MITARGSDDYGWLEVERKIGAMTDGKNPSLM